MISNDPIYSVVVDDVYFKMNNTLTNEQTLIATLFHR